MLIEVGFQQPGFVLGEQFFDKLLSVLVAWHIAVDPGLRRGVCLVASRGETTRTVRSCNR
jgi:hypothetical protein